MDEMLAPTVSEGDESSPSNEDAERRARIEKSRKWLFDDDFVRGEVEKAKKEAEATENPMVRGMVEMSLKTRIDPTTGLFYGHERAQKAYDEEICRLMPMADGDADGDLDHYRFVNPVAAWQGRTGKDFARDFVDVAREVGLNLDEAARLNTGKSQDAMFDLYRYVFPVMEMLVIKKHYTPSIKNN